MTTKPYHTTEKFLTVNVHQSATRKEVIDAVDQALKENQLPFFKDNGKPASESTVSSAATAKAQGTADLAVPVKAPAPPLGPKDGLLILVQQEGW